MKPGGRVVIVELVLNEDHISPTIPATFSLTMLAGTPNGDAYTFRELQQMLEGAGFHDSEQHRLSPTFFSVVIGTTHGFPGIRTRNMGLIP
jgi:hypothetical protein